MCLTLIGEMMILNSEKNAYDYSFSSLVENRPLPLSSFRSKVILVVNVASRCGFRSQFKELEELYQKYKERGFIIIGVPSNDFGNQEPGTSQEINQFCNMNYALTYPFTLKERVKGENAHPFYLWAKEQLGYIAAPKWNFHKYLISRQGKLIDYFYPLTSPKALRFIKALEKALEEDIISAKD